ncbi:protein TolQ [Gammaproteobacteria bacterium]|nr:protein TolQ [Gammaproteobacteria bacterium]|tara:strand:- start:16316 stop:16984 length:669 start_codon:yes stop_codon:yes gene_type:complete
MDTSILTLFLNASFVVKSVIVILIIASILSWMFIFERWIFISKSKDNLSSFEDLFWSDLGVERILEIGNDEEHVPFGAECIFRSGYTDYKRLSSQDLEAEVVMESVLRNMKVSLSREQMLLENHLPFLATVASVSPYIGLFGTVWGIMNSFRGLAGANQATLAAVAPGISEALIATAIGLFAAIPALIAYNRFISESDYLLSGYESFMDEFAAVLHREIHSR